MRRGFVALLLLLLAAPIGLAARFPAGVPSTTNNDDSCDIAALPAATLLLPYFEVNLTTPAGKSTIFTVTNVTQSPQIARVTLWTDWSYPVFTFDIFLTGYDVQAISLYDVLSRGLVASPYGATSKRDVGVRSLENDANPLLDLSGCDQIPIAIPPSILADIQSALTTGLTSKCGTARVGEMHTEAAIGYATIDVVKGCDATMPVDDDYFTQQILFENVLVGDYQHIEFDDNFAQGGTMVHIRAIPEGGTPDATTVTFDRTFYSRYQNGGTVDRRQPLPSTFAARWISGGAASFNGAMKIWREGSTGADADCAVGAAKGGILDIVRFDEEENPTVVPPSCCCITCPPQEPVRIPSASRVAFTNLSVFPPNPDGGVAGWMYMNFEDHQSRAPVEQSWAIISMGAEGRFSVDLDATALGNGCGPALPVTDESGGPPAIAPAPNDNGAKTSTLLATSDNDDSCDIMIAPAATLLLPYFEVDLRSQLEDTLFTVTNVSRLPQIAYVTIWTDWAYPVLGFNVFLTGYDTQSISLFDVLSRGVIAPPNGTSNESDTGDRSADNDDNPLLDTANCDRLAVVIPAVITEDVRRALTSGLGRACGAAVPIGGVHERATGYVTIDVVASCNIAFATEARYYSEELLYDNVLTGDYQHVDRMGNFAQSGSMVHIRAIPEGGSDRSATTNLPRTFYSRYQNGGKSDRRQPLPSTFAARWISQGPSAFNASLSIWREGVTEENTCVMTPNRAIASTDIVRFDEDENATTVLCWQSFCPDPAPRLPATSRNSAANTAVFPPNPGGDIAGWLYLNLDNELPGSASQNWVTVTMAAEGRYSTDFDAPALGNGCSPPSPFTMEDGTAPAIAPPSNGN